MFFPLKICISQEKNLLLEKTKKEHVTQRLMVPGRESDSISTGS
jgi:hypothetical protein